jgi:deoxyribonuclease IV
MNKNRITGEILETNSKLKIGTHLSVAKGYAALARDTVKIGANTFQLFIRNPRGARAKEINPEEIEAFQTTCLRKRWPERVVKSADALRN